MVWAEATDSDSNPCYSNLDRIDRVRIGGSGPYQLQCFVGSALSATLVGSWSTSADALDALRRLIDGVDPSTY